MFLGMVAAVLLNSDGANSQAGRQPPPQFDLRRAVQWMFGKRPAATTALAPGNEKRGGSDAELSDARTEHRCRNYVLGDPALRATGMTIRVLQGVAYLEGSTSSRWLRVRAEQLAQRVPGVLRVENHLRVAEEAGAKPLAPSAQEAAAPRAAWEVPRRPVSATSSSTFTASRPKSLPAADREPTVTTYSVRRAEPRQGVVPPSPAGVTEADTKQKSGRLIPWTRPVGQPQSIWPSPFGGMPAAPQPATPSGSILDPLDFEIRRVVASRQDVKGVAFEREGRDVVLKGRIPPEKLFVLLAEVGRIPGVGTVSVAPDAAGALGDQSPNTSAIE